MSVIPQSLQRDKALHYHATLDPDFIAELPLPKNRKARLAAASILTDARTEADGWDRDTSYSRSNDWWSRERRYIGAYTRTNVISAVDRFIKDGLLEGETAPAKKGGTGRQSVFRAARKLLEIPAPTPDFTPTELVVLRDRNKDQIDYRDTDLTHSIRHQLQSQNEAVTAADITLDTPDAIHRGCYAEFERDGGKTTVNFARCEVCRIFNNGSFSEGGRCAGGWWMYVPSEYRAAILIGGMATGEVDYEANHAHLAYSLAGKTLDGNPYDLPGWDRKDAKTAFFIILNAGAGKGRGGYRSAVLAVAKDMFEGDRKKAAALVDALKLRHAPIADLFHTGVGLKLQNTDSRIMDRVLAGCRKRGIVALPVHDSAIVQAGHLDCLCEEMEAAAEAEIHRAIPLKIKVDS